MSRSRATGAFKLACVICGVCIIAPDAARGRAASGSIRPPLAPPEVQATPQPAQALKPHMIAGSGPCVQVDIAGDRAGHLECASEALRQAVGAVRDEAEAAREASVAGAGSPDVQVGVASRAGTRLRLRENFGVSVRPPAIPTPIITDPRGPRQ